MRALLIVGWLLLPILLGAYHYGPGQERLRLDDVATVLAQADGYAARQEWAKAATAYDDALRLLPADRLADQRRIRLERAKAQLLSKQLPAAHDDLRSLVEELLADQGADPTLLAQARSAQANSQYYMTWLMRLEGLGKDAWEPEIEAARQEYRLLAEQAESAGDMTAAKTHREDLEATIRLARMDLGELQGLPLPSQ
jgi:hypothetical protein